MPLSEVSQLPLDYVHRVNSVPFLLASLDALYHEAHGISGDHTLFVTSFYLLVALALLWGTPGTVWYKAGCWVQPISGRNVIFCGPSGILRRFRLYAARLGLCLTESFLREGDNRAISLQSYWALPDTVHMDMAQLDMLSVQMPSEYLFSFFDGNPVGFRPSLSGNGPTFYVSSLLGLTGQSPWLYLALRRRNHNRLRRPDRAITGVMECLALLPGALRTEGNPGQGSVLLLRRLGRLLGLAQVDSEFVTPSDSLSTYFNSVLAQDRERASVSYFQLDLEYLDDMELLAMADSDEDDEDFGDVF
uniref:34K protein n=1 Tax=Bird's-foot trefoil enamovirus 1 TaxID=2283314 RepID=A0A9Y0XBK7_9VIRU|nr:TPA_asm: putative 34K protein [Bird's-foot trefoil enamovirus 1]